MGSCIKLNRVKSLNEYFEKFDFIYEINYLKFMSKEDLSKHYMTQTVF